MLFRAYIRPRASLQPWRRLRPTRNLSFSAPLRSDIHSEILSILSETGPVSAETQEQKTPKKTGILILSPEQTKNKTYDRYVATVAKTHDRAKRGTKRGAKTVSLQAFDFESHTGSGSTESASDTNSAIENFRPGSASGLTHFSIKHVVSDLAASFTKSQLVDYVQKHGRAHYRSKHNKTQLAETIVCKVWGATGNSLDNVFLKEQVPLTRQEMFLLLSKRGALLRLLRSTVTSLDFDAKRRELVFVGTETQIFNAKVNLEHRFEGAVREEIDLKEISDAYDEKFGYVPFAEIGRLIEVYFQHLHADTYELCALDAAQIKRIKRLLVWFLDYNMHHSSVLHLPEPDVLARAALLPHSDEYSMTWIDRSKAHFELVDEVGSRAVPSMVAREIARFSDKSLVRPDAQMDYDVSREFSESGVTDETFESLESLSLLADAEGQFDTDKNHSKTDEVSSESDPLETVIEDIVAKQYPPENSGENAAKSTLLSPEKKSLLYNQLVDFHYRKSLFGVQEKDVDAPIFTVTLGRVLFQKEKEANGMLTSPPSKEELSASYTFNTNISSAYDKVLHEGFGDDSLDSSYSDPHSYSLQFKFLPSPYALDKKTKSDRYMKYPPIEMWMQLNENKVVDIESMQVVTVEGENASYVCLPDCASDLKVSCQVTGRVIHDATETDANVTETGTETKANGSDLGGLFGATSSKFSRLGSQPGIQTFLEESRLDFSGKNRTSIAPYVDVVIDGTPIRYSFVCVNYRRELELELDSGRLVQVSVVDGGSLGGRRAEVTFIGDFSAGVDRAAFDALMDDACAFVEDL